MNGYYGFVPRHLQHQILPPPVQAPNGLALYTRTIPSQNSGRKREHPDTNAAPDSSLVNGNSPFFCNGAYGSDMERARPQYAEYEKAKVCGIYACFVDVCIYPRCNVTYCVLT